MSTSEEPTVITLDNTNSIQILAQYIEHAQQKGAYLLSEAEILKRAVEFLLNNVPDNELNDINSKNLLIQGIHKGQRHGAYTLNDAALLSKVVNFVASSQQLQQNPTVPNASEHENLVKQENVSEENNNIDDLSDLAEPIPLKPKEV